MQTTKIRLIGIVLGVSLFVPTLIAQQSNTASQSAEQILALQNQMPEEGSEAYAHLQQEIHLDLRSAGLEEALNVIAAQADLKLMYRKALLLVDKKVSFQNRSVSIYDALWEILDGTGIQFAISQNRQLVLLRMRDVVKVREERVQETISGQVTNASTGESLPVVNIAVKGTMTGTTTDMNGEFELTVPSLSDILIFSLVGYQRLEVPINGRTEINVEMQMDISALDEIVVTGYSEQARGNITGSISIVDVDAMRTFPTGSAEQALQGHASGVNVLTTGSPGEKSDIFIRGITNFGDSQPLVLVDGVEVDLNDVHPSDIESMQVLKDAGAAAIYGVRGANGVIIVTTKKGQRGDGITVNYDSYVGVQLPLPGNPYGILDPEDQMRLQLIANPNDELYKNGMPDYLYRGPGGSGNAFEGDPEVDPSKYNFDPSDPTNPNSYIIQKANKEGTNWFQETFNRAPVVNQNLSLSGGSETVTYFLSLNHLNQEGTLLNTHLKRSSVRLNTSFNASDDIQFGQNLYLYDKDNPLHASNTGQFAVLAYMYQFQPLIPLYDIAGNHGGTRAGAGIGDRTNPHALKDRDANDMHNTFNAEGNVFANIEFMENFSARSTLGSKIENTNQQSFSHTPYEQSDGFVRPNSFSTSSSSFTRLMWTNILEYTNLIGSHDVTVLLGSEAISNKGRTLSGSRQEYFNASIDYVTLSTGTSNVQNASSVFENTVFSLFGDIKYRLDNKYLFSATVRRDGSSRFGDESKYGIFPSVSLGWRLSNENFMSDLEWLDDLRLKGSYGVLGSQNNVSPDNQFDLFGGGFGNAYYPIGGGPGIAQGFFNQRIGNPRTSWERNIITNIGIDLAILQKFNFTLEYYKKTVDGLLFPQPLPATVGGATFPTVNIGDIQNEGVDFSASYSTKINSEAEFSVTGNITTYNNKIIDVPEPGFFNSGSHQQLGGSVVRNQIGHPVSSFYGYKVIGLFQSDEEVSSSATQTDAAPGRFKYKDVDGDGIITSDDRTIIGNPNPDFIYGMNLNVYYKNFDLSTNIYGSYGADIVNTTRTYLDFFGVYYGNAKGNRLLNAWSPDNTDTIVPKLEPLQSFSTTATMNSYFVEDGSYMRMRSFVIGYSIPPDILQKFGITNLRIYAQAKNLFTITNYSGLNPEIGGNSASFGIDYGTYPSNERSFYLGINLSL